MRSTTWENNKVAILKAIDKLSWQNERLPTQLEIAAEAGLSRKTVCVHMKEYGRMNMFGTELLHLKCMSSQIFFRLMKATMNGSIPATKLVLQMLGLPEKKTGREG